jgi:hypothetical protein
MKSVLISVDFVYKEDGTLTPLELNTNTLSEYAAGEITAENFLEKTDGMWPHADLHNYMQSGSLSKLKLISAGGSAQYFKVFSEFYGYEYELIPVGQDSITVPEVEDADDTLIIRVAYDTYALIDDLYARDNYEFLNLISSESFASPVCFTANDLDTISSFESSQDGTLPNYVIKPRTPGYSELEYPKIYRLESETELNNLKSNLLSSEYIQKYEFNTTSSLLDSRTFHLRSMNLLIGNNLDIINIHNYVSQNALSVDNTLLVYNTEIDSVSKQLDPLFASKFYPTYYTRKGLAYHHDENDLVLSPDDTLIDFEQIQEGTILKDVFFNEQIDNFNYGDLTDVNTFNISSSAVTDINYTTNGGIFINITASHETYGEFSWYDGVENRYLVDDQVTEDKIIYTKGGYILPGDKIFIYNKALNEMIPLTVTSKTYEIKQLKVYTIGLSPVSEFFVQLDSNNSDLYLVQHNGCKSISCSSSGLNSCYQSYCVDCGKNAIDCIQCGGLTTQVCPA